MCAEGIMNYSKYVSGIADPWVYGMLSNNLMHCKITGQQHHLSEVAM